MIPLERGIDMLELPTTPGGFRCIYADPAWSFKTYGKNGHDKSPEAHYPTMALEDIKALPVGDVAAKDCFLLMWATWPVLDQALDLMGSWGFKYTTGGAWAKQSSTGKKWQFGTGYIFRSASEPLLVGKRGKPIWKSKSERNLWVSPVREHSRKPDEVVEMIERSIDGPFLELNARTTRQGWSVWGNETNKFGNVP